MKLAITSGDGNPASPFSPRFGRSNYFLFVDSTVEESGDGEWTARENPAADAHGGAGPQAVKFLADHQVDAVISGRFGPKAFRALEEAGITPFAVEADTPEGLLAKFQDGKFTPAGAASGPGFHS